MVNSTLNWTSLAGIFLALYAIPACGGAFSQLYFNLNRRADTSPAVLSKLLMNMAQLAGRLVLIPVGGILFFQGWRLDPILQLGVFLLALGIVIESASAVVSDYQKWRARQHRN
jgi:hypothetical protein